MLKPHVIFNHLQNPYKAFNNFNSRNVNNFGPNASQTGDKGQVQFQNPSQSGYVNHNQPRRQVRFNDSGPQVRLYSQQGAGYRDIDKRNGQTDPPIRRPLFASTGKWLNSEATGGGVGPSPRTTANQPCTPREAMYVLYVLCVLCVLYVLCVLCVLCVLYVLCVLCVLYVLCVLCVLPIHH